MGLKRLSPIIAAHGIGIDTVELGAISLVRLKIWAFRSTGGEIIP